MTDKERKQFEKLSIYDRICKIIERDLKALPQLKVKAVDQRKLVVYYYDEIRQDIYMRYLNDYLINNLALIYVGHVTEYNDIKLESDKEKEN
jgi:hypothetical protein